MAFDNFGWPFKRVKTINDLIAHLDSQKVPGHGRFNYRDDRFIRFYLQYFINRHAAKS